MSELEFKSFTSAPFAAAIDSFYGQLDRSESASFVSALRAFDSVDASAMAAAHVSELARLYFNGNSEVRSGLADFLPSFGHVRICSRGDVALSYSVRLPRAEVAGSLSTSTRDEYHRVDKGSLEVIECNRTGAEGSGHFLPARSARASAGDVVLRLAGTSAYSLNPIERCHVFSVAGWSQGDFGSNIDPETGTVLSQSFASPDDCILANILELCAIHPSALLGERALSCTAHANYRVRLSALKAALVAGALSAEHAVRMASDDGHPLIRQMGARFAEVAA